MSDVWKNLLVVLEFLSDLRNPKLPHLNSKSVLRRFLVVRGFLVGFLGKFLVLNWGDFLLRDFSMVLLCLLLLVLCSYV